jgi:hypothetical protein
MGMFPSLDNNSKKNLFNIQHQRLEQNIYRKNTKLNFFRVVAVFCITFLYSQSFFSTKIFMRNLCNIVWNKRRKTRDFVGLFFKQKNSIKNVEKVETIRKSINNSVYSVFFNIAKIHVQELFIRDLLKLKTNHFR